MSEWPQRADSTVADWATSGSWEMCSKADRQDATPASYSHTVKSLSAAIRLRSQLKADTPRPSQCIAPRWANVPIGVLRFALVRCATRCFDFPSVLRLVLQRVVQFSAFGVDARKIGEVQSERALVGDGPATLYRDVLVEAVQRCVEVPERPIQVGVIAERAMNLPLGADASVKGQRSLVVRAGAGQVTRPRVNLTKSGWLREGRWSMSSVTAKPPDRLSEPQTMVELAIASAVL
jgi:hypothetical protein